MIVVAIDGPAGSGKSTIASALAERLGVPHVDTGAYYRAATLAVLRAGADVRNGPRCAAVISAARIERRGSRTFLDGVDVEDEIRGPAVTAAVSAVSAHREVRRVLLPLQREGVSAEGAVVEGRDAGTAVVPDATLKVWLTADPRERARRRAAQLGDTQTEAVEAQHADLVRRDARDAGQMAAARDAVELDTTGSDVDRVVDEVVKLAGERARAGTEGGR